MDEKKLKWYYEAFTSAWKIFRTFKDLRTDEDRQRLKWAAERIYEKYPGAFMRELIWVVFNELDRRAKGGKT